MTTRTRKPKVVKVIRKKWLIHAIFECRTCGEQWQNYLTAGDKSFRHAKRTGHDVRGEYGYAIHYEVEK